MSTIFASENLEKDYLLFEKQLSKIKRNKYLISDNLRPHLKKYHRLTYLIALFDKKLGDKWKAEPNKFLFVSEILSDLLSNSEISLLGFYNSSKILSRRFIENFYNHIFYYDHQIEYELLNLGRNEYTPIADLKKYYLSHPKINIQIDTDILIRTYNDELFNHYHELCKHVHTKGYYFMNLAKNLSEIKIDIDIEKHFELTNQYSLLIIYLLYKFHSDLVFTSVEKTLIATTFTRPVRRSLLS